jgi:abortive infection bacteriophage resistance protein
VPGIEMIDITDAKTNHELPFWLVSNMHRFGNLGPVKDFTLQKQDTGIFDLKRTTGPLAEPSGLQ